MLYFKQVVVLRILIPTQKINYFKRLNMVDLNIAKLNLALTELIASGRTITNYSKTVKNGFLLADHLRTDGATNPQGGKKPFTSDFPVTPENCFQQVLELFHKRLGSRNVSYSTRMTAEEVDKIKDIFVYFINEAYKEQYEHYIAYIELHNSVFTLLHIAISAIIDSNNYKERAAEIKDDAFDRICMDIAKDIQEGIAQGTLFEDHLVDIANQMRDPSSFAVINAKDLDLYSALLKTVELTLEMLEGKKGITHYEPLIKELIQMTVDQAFETIHPKKFFGFIDRGYSLSSVEQITKTCCKHLKFKHDSTKCQVNFQDLSNALMWHYSIIKNSLRHMNNRHTMPENPCSFVNLFEYMDYALQSGTAWTINPMLFPLLEKYAKKYLLAAAPKEPESAE